MVDIFTDIGTAFVLGVLTPLTAVCVLPLYPGFLAYLSNKLKGGEDDKRLLIYLGLIVTAGVIVFMSILGLVFTSILQVSLTAVIGIVSPIAFGILFVMSILLILNIDIGRIFPKIHSPVVDNPKSSAFIFGFFFGAIVVPCNPLFIAALFTRIVAGVSFVGSILSFLAFGIGIAFPLLLFTVLSSAKTGAIIGFLTKNRRPINMVSGVIMLIISVYYLVFVFRLFG